MTSPDQTRAFKTKSGRILGALVATLLAAAGPDGAAAQSRDQIRITGSSTLYPFSTAVSEEFGRTTDYDAPIVEGIGSGGGLKQFCSGLGTAFPDIANASRRIKASEFDLCQKNGVSEIMEIKIGYDGIVLANTKEAPQLSLSMAEIYQALAATIPGLESPKTVNAQGTPSTQHIERAHSPNPHTPNPHTPNPHTPNPHTMWVDIRADLPSAPITVLGPPPTSGTRDAFNELAMVGGCNDYLRMRGLTLSDPDQYRIRCQSIREDGAFIDSGENDNLIVQKLQANWDAVGVFGFSFLDQNSDVLQPVRIKTGDNPGVPPTFDSIADGAYPIFRALYVYVKKAHIGVIPGIPEYLRAFTSEDAWGDFGYLIDRGLIPLSEGERSLYRDIVDRQTVMTRPE